MLETIEEDFAEQFSELIEEAGTLLSCIIIMLTVLSFTVILLVVYFGIYSVIKKCNMYSNKKKM